MINKTIYISNKTVAYAAVKIAIAGVFGYALFIMLYTIIRSSITIYNVIPSGERRNILFLNSFSIAYSVSIFSILMALLSSILTAIAAIILKKLLQYFNPNFSNRKAIVLSCITAFVTLIVLYLVLYALLKNWMTFDYMETFVFWFLLPAIFFMVGCIIGGKQLNKILLNNLKL